uniref:C-type lectin domain-containing protein n=1 Tax=Acrobeloides nanus TaxID=290746 RepID=A0A914CTB0_9BILA
MSFSVVLTLLIPLVVAINSDTTPAPPTTTDTVICPNGTRRFGDLCYKAIKSPKTWINAEFDCIKQGGNLASVSSSFLNKFLVDSAKENFDSPGAFWIGGTSSLTNDSSWAWIDWSNMSYTNWASDNWTYITATNKCYKILPKNTTWFNHRTTCLNLGADLVSIHSQRDNFIIGSYALTSLNANQNQSFYIGLSYNTSSQTWFWVDNTPVDYTQFIYSTTSSYQLVGMIDMVPTSLQYVWDYDYYGTSSLPSICESDTFFMKKLKNVMKIKL